MSFSSFLSSNKGLFRLFIIPTTIEFLLVEPEIEHSVRFNNWKLEEFKLEDTYIGSFEVACQEVANKVIDYLRDEKAIMSLVAEGFIYPVTMKENNFISRRLKLNHEETESYDDITIFTVPCRHFRKI